MFQSKFYNIIKKKKNLEERCNVTVCRCAQLELQDCTLRELCLSIQRDGEPLDTPFVCRVGEITVSSYHKIVTQISCIFKDKGFHLSFHC